MYNSCGINGVRCGGNIEPEFAKSGPFQPQNRTGNRPFASGGPDITPAGAGISGTSSVSCGIAPGAGLCVSRVRMNKYLFLPVLAGSLILTGCGKKDEAPAPVAAAPAVATFEFTANDTMKFNVTRVEANAGQDVKVIMTNMGNIPKAAMAHNWVLLKKGADPKAFADAASVAGTTDYIPAALADQIIAHTKLLGPKQSDEVDFKAPTEPGEYHFLCSFPAHYLSGMTGVLVVK
jgi:azurin